MRLVLVLAACLVLAGCTQSASSQSRADDSPPESSSPPASSTLEPTPTPRMQSVQDEVQFSGTLGASACVYDGGGISCANVGGSNVLRYLHDRKGNLTEGSLTVSFSPAAGMGPSVQASIVEDCPGTCRHVRGLEGAGPDFTSPSVGTGGSYDLTIPAATILENQTLSIRVAPILLTSLASASPVYDITIQGTLGFRIPA